jgi:ATP-dependent Clp protease ATP-binding subunit ClpA
MLIDRVLNKNFAFLNELTQKLKNRPYSLILFDEIEKAHHEVFNVFLQVLDEGKLTDSTGSEVNFKNAIIVMTSNIGTKDILEGNTLGFGAKSDVLKNDKSRVFRELEKHFKPEFLNRIDEKIVFNPLGKEQIDAITKIEMDEVLNRMTCNGYEISASEEVILHVSKTGYDKKYGARPIKREIQDKVGNIIAKAILLGEINTNDKYSLVLENEQIKIVQDIQKTKKNDRNKSK